MKLSCPIAVDGSILPSGRPLAIDSPNIISRTADEMTTRYTAQQSKVSVEDGVLRVSVQPAEEYAIKTDLKRPERLGLMLVGWGGNNGSTLTASLLANKLGLEWESRRGTEKANFLGSLVMASCASVGSDALGHEISVPLTSLVPFTDPCEIVVGGWDINSMSIGDALRRSRVLDPDLIRQVKPHLDALKPLPSIFDPSFVASNQADRADNVLVGSKFQQIDQICLDIEQFKKSHGLDRVIVMWTANTERYCQVKAGVHDTYKNLVKALIEDEPEISPSTMFAVAAVLCKCPFINGSPQNTFVPAVIELAETMGVPIAGDDFKSGQTKIKSVLVDFLVSSGIKPLSIVSYNHLGNNDGRNLDEAAQFRSKEISKRGVVEDMVAGSPVLYPVDSEKEAAGPNHRVVIEYVPAVGDSKRAMDEYESEIFMGGRHTLAMHNTCEDSLLAAPLMIDLVLLMEFLGRVQVARQAGPDGELKFESMHAVYSLLAYGLKAPLYAKGRQAVNALQRQRRAIEGLLRICAGLPLQDDLALNTRF